ncbi:MAG: hypothetical protein E6J14_13190 [Chloroflexi bacterium]|nr:MAG: hypothetical protein E6J14_13190 [Chloroflexota bacterium]
MALTEPDDQRRGDANPAHEDSTRVAILLDLVLMAAGIVLLATSSVTIFGDAATRYQALTGFLSQGTKPAMRYSFAGPLFSAPLYFIGNALGDPMTWTGRYNLVLLVLLLFALWLLLRRRMQSRALRSFLLLLIGASMFPAHILSYYGETFTAVLVAAGTAAVAAGPSLWGWAPTMLGVVNTPAALGGLALLTFKKMLDDKRLRYLLALPVVIGLIQLDYYSRTGHPVSAAYANDAGFPTIMPYSGRPEFSYPFGFGVLSILFSFGKGLVFFAPGLLLPVRARLHTLGRHLWDTYLLWLLFVAGLVLIYARWWAWYGGLYWGPRLFLFASIPAAMAIAVAAERPSRSLLGRILLLAVLGLSVWVAINGFVYSQANLDVCFANNYALEHLCWYTPEFSVLWHPFVQTKALTGHDIAFILFGAAVFVRVALPVLATIAHDVATALGRLRAPASWTAWRL